MSRKKINHGHPHVQPKTAPPPPVVPPGNQGANPTGDNEDGNPEHPHASPKLPHKLTGDQRWSRANVIINGILMVATGLLFGVAYFSLNTSNSYLQTNQKQFALNNEPFLQLADIAIYIRSGYPIQLSGKIDNLGTMPVKSYSHTLKIEWIDKSDSVGLFNNPFDYVHLRQLDKSIIYYSKGTSTNFFLQWYMADDSILRYIEKKLWVLSGDYIYHNPITGSFREYKCSMVFTPTAPGIHAFDVTKWTYTWNENKDIDSSVAVSK